MIDADSLEIPDTYAEIAYSTLIHLLDSNPKPERIIEECEDALFSYLLHPEPGEGISERGVMFYRR